MSSKEASVGDVTSYNYRPISIIPTIARGFEKLICNQLYQYFVNNELLSNQQFGFWSLHSTALAFSKVTNQWLLSLDKGCMNSVVFLDIKKAFDTLDHQILSDKLRCYGIHDGELTFFKSYLDGRAQCCQDNGVSSTMKPIYCGVPQGSILGPLLFIIMNDLPAGVSDISITMYADHSLQLQKSSNT